MGIVLPNVLIRHDPETATSPLVLDSPHSGHIYPKEFDFACPELVLRQAEDSFVGDLFSSAPRHGAVLVEALFPRSFIDVNRAIDDIDPQLLASAWPRPPRPSEKSRVGMGLIRRICKPGMPVYARKLAVEEVEARINTYYKPYHETLSTALTETWQRFGAVWHLNCHSMPSTSASQARGGGWERADFVLGDRDGVTCSTSFTNMVARTLEQMGYSVRINDPYKGVEIVRRYGAPSRGFHSLQIEINRRLYLNETTVQPTPGYARLKRNLSALLAAIRAYAEDQIFAAAAD